MTVTAAGTRRFLRLDLASRAALLSFASNLVLVALKLSAGFAFGSVAVLGDGIDSAEDVFSSALTFFTVRLAMQPADEEHPYGHGKAESLAAMSQAALIGAGAIFVVAAALRRVAGEAGAIDVGPSLVVMGIAVAMNLAVGAYSFHAARSSGSVAIHSDAHHLMTNVVQAGAVIVGLALVGITGNDVFDPIVALLLAAYLLWVAFTILRSALRELIDTALPEDEVAKLERCLSEEPYGVRGYHALRTRKSGREKYIDLHIVIDPAMTVSEAHRRMEEIETHIGELIPGAIVTIHIDPDEPGTNTPHPAAEPSHALRVHSH